MMILSSRCSIVRFHFGPQPVDVGRRPRGTTMTADRGGTSQGLVDELGHVCKQTCVPGDYGSAPQLVCRDTVVTTFAQLGCLILIMCTAAAINFCDLALIACYVDGRKPTDIEWRYTESGERVRVSVKSGRIIPLPSGAKELDDFVNPTIYEGLCILLCRVTTCLENLEMSGNLTAVREMSRIFTKNQGNVREKILSGKSCLKLLL